MSRSPSLADFQMILKPSLVSGFLQMLKATLFCEFLASLSFGSESADQVSNFLATLGYPLYEA